MRLTIPRLRNKLSLIPTPFELAGTRSTIAIVEGEVQYMQCKLCVASRFPSSPDATYRLVIISEGRGRIGRARKARPAENRDLVASVGLGDSND